MELILPNILVGLGALIILILGTIHLAYTFWGPKLSPRNPELRTFMGEVAPVISDQTNMWSAWIGFNASHSMGAMLFGLVFGYLALFEAEVLFGSLYLLTVGLLMLVGLLVLGKRYWFSVPFAGISLSLSCYVAGIVAFWL